MRQRRSFLVDEAELDITLVSNERLCHSKGCLQTNSLESQHDNTLPMQPYSSSVQNKIKKSSEKVHIKSIRKIKKIADESYFRHVVPVDAKHRH